MSVSPTRKKDMLASLLKSSIETEGAAAGENFKYLPAKVSSEGDAYNDAYNDKDINTKFFKDSCITINLEGDSNNDKVIGNNSSVSPITDNDRYSNSNSDSIIVRSRHDVSTINDIIMDEDNAEDIDTNINNNSNYTYNSNSTSSLDNSSENAISLIDNTNLQENLASLVSQDNLVSSKFIRAPLKRTLSISLSPYEAFTPLVAAASKEGNQKDLPLVNSFGEYGDSINLDTKVFLSKDKEFSVKTSCLHNYQFSSVNNEYSNIFNNPAYSFYNDSYNTVDYKSYYNPVDLKDSNSVSEFIDYSSKDYFNSSIKASTNFSLYIEDGSAAPYNKIRNEIEKDNGSMSDHESSGNELAVDFSTSEERKRKTQKQLTNLEKGNISFHANFKDFDKVYSSFVPSTPPLNNRTGCRINQESKFNKNFRPSTISIYGRNFKNFFKNKYEITNNIENIPNHFLKHFSYKPEKRSLNWRQLCRSKRAYFGPRENDLKLVAKNLNQRISLIEDETSFADRLKAVVHEVCMESSKISSNNNNKESEEAIQQIYYLTQEILNKRQNDVQLIQSTYALLCDLLRHEDDLKVIVDKSIAEKTFVQPKSEQKISVLSSESTEHLAF